MNEYPEAVPGFLLATQPPEPVVEVSAEEVESGSVVFETSVACKGGVVTIEVIDTPVGPVLQLSATGGGRKPAPIKLDRYQAGALRAAINGAVGVAETL